MALFQVFSALLFPLTGSAKWRGKVQGFWSGIKAWGCWCRTKGFQAVVLPNHSSVLSTWVAFSFLDETTATIGPRRTYQWGNKLWNYIVFYTEKKIIFWDVTGFLWRLNYNTVQPVEIISSFCANIINSSMSVEISKKNSGMPQPITYTVRTQYNKWNLYLHGVYFDNISNQQMSVEFIVFVLFLFLKNKNWKIKENIYHPS